MHFKTVYILILLSLCYEHGLRAQNLIKNPSFEEFAECPNALGTFDKHVRYWSTPTQGSTDYFNTCSKVMGAPENFNGIQHPKFGNAYSGFYFYAPGDYREYVQAQLSQTLHKGKEYHLEFYVSLAEGSDFAVKDFGVVLSHKAVDVTTKKQLSKGKLYQIKGNRHQIFEVSHVEFHQDKSIWLKVTLDFMAKGFERFLILGNLRDNKSTKKVQTKRKETKKGAYYYIDMVSLRMKGVDGMQVLDIETVYQFKNVHFDFDRFALDNEAKEELEVLMEQLVKNKDLVLEIHGHTDNAGGSSYNLKLSQNRAKVIADYFLENGISKQRISWFGHGSKKPKTKNDTEAGRALNRRAEFLLKSKE